jgi:cyclohexanone monooxygenase
MLMCKRPCFHNEYLPTFNLPNVHLVDTKGKGITEIAEGGPVFDGKVYEVDVLIYATGFEVQKTGIYNRIEGKGGLEINEKYSEGIRTLVGIHTHGYPNLFIMGGYQASFQFNLTNIVHARLLQLRGRVQPPPGRQLQRFVPPLRRAHGQRPRPHGRQLRVHQPALRPARQRLRHTSGRASR